MIDAQKETQSQLKNGGIYWISMATRLKNALSRTVGTGKHATSTTASSYPEPFMLKIGKRTNLPVESSPHWAKFVDGRMVGNATGRSSGV